jgi:hypothetical protein
LGEYLKRDFILEILESGLIDDDRSLLLGVAIVLLRLHVGLLVGLLVCRLPIGWTSSSRHNHCLSSGVIVFHCCLGHHLSLVISLLLLMNTYSNDNDQNHNSTNHTSYNGPHRRIGGPIIIIIVGVVVVIAGCIVGIIGVRTIVTRARSIIVATIIVAA